MGDLEEHGNISNASERVREWKRIIRSILIEGELHNAWNIKICNKGAPSPLVPSLWNSVFFLCRAWG